MSFFQPPPLPSTKLGRHRQLSSLAGVHVSPLCLGGMSIGDQWEKLGMGAMNKESSFKLLDAFYDAGGNFIDTASNYQNESSEKFIGEWMAQRGVRDQMVIATKVRSSLCQRYTRNRLAADIIGVHSTLPCTRWAGTTSSRSQRTSAIA